MFVFMEKIEVSDFIILWKFADTITSIIFMSFILWVRQFNFYQKIFNGHCYSFDVVYCTSSHYESIKWKMHIYACDWV